MDAMKGISRPACNTSSSTRNEMIRVESAVEHLSKSKGIARTLLSSAFCSAINNNKWMYLLVWNKMA